MRKMLIMFIALGFIAGRPVIAEDSLVDRTGKEIKKGGEAAAGGIDKGVKAVEPVVKKGGNAAVKGIKKGGEWVGRGLKKVGEKLENVGKS